MQIPQWLIDVVLKLKCPLCDAPMSDDHIVSFGWRENKDPEKDFFVDYKCPAPECGKKIIIPLKGISLEEFAMHVMEETMDEEMDNFDENEEFDSGEVEPYKKADPDAPKAKKRKPKSKIQDEEVDNFKDKMKDCDFSIEAFEAFLEDIGLTQDKIDQYKDEYKDK